MEIKPIKTRYNGYLFRSRAEARWAVLFDELNIKYIYEPEGYELSDGTRYLPDFYLPEIKTYFEVKPAPDRITDYEWHKILQLQHDANTNVCIGYADMTFQASNVWRDEWEITDADDSDMVECCRCGHRYFRGLQGGWICPYCGVAGDQAAELAGGELKYHVPEAIKKARAAQFEFTEET